VTGADVLLLLDEDATPAVLARREFFVPAPSRSSALTGRERAGGVILHKPVAAVLFPTDFPPLSRRRPDFGGLRHLLVRFGFMLDRLPPQHAYDSATLAVTLDHSQATVLAQRPSLVTTQAAESDSSTVAMSAALDGLAKIGAQRTKTTQRTHTAVQPVITAENRGPAGFGWHYQAQGDVPLFPQIESALAVIELPRDVTELAGALSAEAVVSFHRFGVLTRSRTIPLAPAVPFRLALGPAT
jgi:hypothetical protein